MPGLPITFTDVHFGYRGGGSAVLSGLTCQWPAGALTVVTGPSGRGKSTTLYLAGLMLTADRGRIALGGSDVSGLPDALRSGIRAASIGFVFQDALLDQSRTVLDNVLEGALFAGMPRDAAVRRAHDLLQMVGVVLNANRRPGEVSGGQAQRVALCRALVKQPSVLLADEPTGNLDDAAADVVWGLLADAAHRGATVAVATHDRSRAAAADHRVDL